MPTLTLIAGPNGAGKSTITRIVEIEGLDRLLDPDAIARRINPSNPLAASIAAGREVLTRQAEYLRSGVSFAVETTLAGGRVNVAAVAKRHGFAVHLLFVGTDSPELSILRVQNRVQRGGHFVPEDDVRRRYARSMETRPNCCLQSTSRSSMTTPTLGIVSCSSPKMAASPSAFPTFRRGSPRGKSDKLLRI